MIIYETVPRVFLSDNRLLFGSIRFIKDEIVIVAPLYKDRINYDNLHITYTYNNTVYILNRSAQYIYDVEECCVITKYTHKDLDSIDSINLSYTYDDDKQSGSIVIKKENRTPCRFASMTLFKDDYKLMDAYVKHYINIGVEVMYLYVNMPITNELKAIIKENLGLFNITIYIIDHNILYWDSRVHNTPHSAQPIAVNDFLYLSKGIYDFILLNDFDEYFYLYKDLKLEKGNSYIFENRFSSVANINYKNMHKIITGSKWIMSYKPYGRDGRMKSIYDPLTIDLAGIHMPHIYSSTLQWLDPHSEGFHAHCIDFAEKNRFDYFIKPDDNKPEKIVLARSKKFLL